MKTIFITGAAAGIGKACAEHFAKEGWFVGLYDIDAEAVAGVCASLQAEYGDRFVSAQLDVCEPEQWASCLGSFWQQTGGKLDVLLNNAGILATGGFESVPLAKHHAIAEVNFKAMMTGCHTAFSYLQRTAGSTVINVASASAIFGQPGLASYSATKFAVRGFTEALNLEWRQYDIAVRDIWPLFVQTRMVEQAKGLKSLDSMGVNLTPQDVAKVVFSAAVSRSGKIHWPVGWRTKILAVLMKLSPTALTAWVTAKLAT